MLRWIGAFTIALSAFSGVTSVAMAHSGAATETSTVAAVSPAQADNPIAHYRIYEAAVTRGDLPAMLTSAMLAWETGERVWNGRNPNLPGLAFNAAWALGLNNKINQAQAPAARAVALAAQYPNSVDAKEAAFLLAYSNMMVTQSKRNLEAFDVAAKGVDNGGWSDFLLARAYLDGAKIGLDISMPRVARGLVDRGLAEATRIAPDNNAVRTNLLVLRTQSSLQLNQYGQAVSEVMEARRSYGVPKSTRDLNWAALAAWEAASRAVYLSVIGPRMGTATRIPRAGEMPVWPEDEEKTLSGQPKECIDLKIIRKGPKGPQGIEFPQQGITDRHAGGAFVRAHLDTSGQVINADILSSLPREAFGTAAQAGIRKWKFELPAGTPTQCQVVDVMIVYAFAN